MTMMRSLIKNLNPKEDAMMHWHTQVVDIITNIEVEVYFPLPELGVTKIVTCNFHGDEFDWGIYDMILGRYFKRIRIKSKNL